MNSPLDVLRRLEPVSDAQIARLAQLLCDPTDLTDDSVRELAPQLVGEIARRRGAEIKPVRVLIDGVELVLNSLPQQDCAQADAKALKPDLTDEQTLYGYAPSAVGGGSWVQYALHHVMPICVYDGQVFTTLAGISRDEAMRLKGK